MYSKDNRKQKDDYYPKYSYDKDKFDEEEHEQYFTAEKRLRPNRRKSDKDTRYDN